MDRNPGVGTPDPGDHRPTDARASFGRRFLASAVDGIVVATAVFLIGRVMGIEGPDPADPRILDATGFLSVLVGLSYFAFMEGDEYGQTFGKRLANIRVADIDTGGPIGVPRAMGRHIGRYVSSIPFLLGYLWMLWDPQKQTWHDKFVRSVVVPYGSTLPAPDETRSET